MATVERINEGSSPRLSIDSPWTQSFLVKGVNRDDIFTDEVFAQGLPRRFSMDPTSADRWCDDVVLVATIRPQCHICTAIYRPVRYFFGFIRSSEPERADPEPLDIPILSRWQSTVGGSPVYHMTRVQRVMRQASVMVEVRGVSSETQARAAVNANLGCHYRFGGAFNETPMILLDSPVVRRRSGVVVAYYRFRSTARLPAYPAQTWQGQDIQIPALPPLAEYVPFVSADGRTASVTVRTYDQIYAPGANLPGL